MVKHTFIYIVLIVLVGIAGWFFMNKIKNNSNNADLGSLVAEEESTPTPEAENGGNNEEKWVTLPNGLKILDVVIGPGREAKEGDVVAAHYAGSLEDGTKFDSSYDRGQPFSFILGGGMVIKGWDLGLVGMKVGGKRKLIIPSDLAYGDREMGGGIIPPNSTLNFDIELMAVETPKR